MCDFVYISMVTSCDGLAMAEIRHGKFTKKKFQLKTQQ
jgi:hypothetical protein